MQSRHVPASPFYGWMVAVSEVSKKNDPERLVWVDLHEITRGFQLLRLLHLH